MKIPLILASSSPFRQQLLQKFNLPFESLSPDIDESPLPGETPSALVERLALQKAQAVAKLRTKGLVIASDQVAVHNGEILGKPHTKENAVKQLSRFSGDHVRFLTSLAVMNIESGQTACLVEPFDVYFRQLTEQQINAYLDAEQPYQCAGSFKSEGLGICLFEKLQGDDPNALIGLPVIKLTRLLESFGVDVLALQQG